MLIGKRIKEARLKKGYSQELLGNIINVTKVSISGYENGYKTPTLETFDALVAALDMDANYALGKEIIALSEESANYMVKISNDDLKIIKEFRKKRKLYDLLCSNPARVVENIDRNIVKEYE